MTPPFRHRLERDTPIVLDAAMGTELSRRGANTAPPLWSARALVEAPELVEKVHRENVAAGAEILTIASFRLHARNIRESSCSLSQGELIARAVALAHRAAFEVSSKVNGEPAHRATPQQERREGSPRNAAIPPSKKSAIAIAGSLAPLEDCYQPARVPKQENILSSEHSEMAAALAAAGVDLVTSHQTSWAWGSAFRAAGFISVPSKRIAALSPAVAEYMSPFAAAIHNAHLTAGDGAGPTNLISSRAHPVTASYDKAA